MFSATLAASSTLVTALLIGTLRSISCIFLTNRSLSSVFRIALIGVPRISTLYFLKIPFSASSTPTFNAVCPPKPSNTPSGRSLVKNTLYRPNNQMFESLQYLD